MSQTALFDLDAIEQQHAADRLRDEYEAGPSRGLQARDRYHWVAEQMYIAARDSRFGIAVDGRMASFCPFPVFGVSMCEPLHRILLKGEEWTPLARTARCGLTVMDRDCGVPCGYEGMARWRAAGPNERLWLAVCTRCDWEARETNDRDVALVDGFDHCWPGWRDVPALKRPVSSIEKADLAKSWWHKHVEVCERLVPGWEADGYPLLTIRQPIGTRSHQSQILGRWDVWSDIGKATAR